MHVSGVWRLAAGNQMQLIVFPDFEPDVSVVLKRIWHHFRLDNVTIKTCALFQVRDIQCDVIEARLHSCRRNFNPAALRLRKRAQGRFSARVEFFRKCRARCKVIRALTLILSQRERKQNSRFSRLLAATHGQQFAQRFRIGHWCFTGEIFAHVSGRFSVNHRHRADRF